MYREVVKLLPEEIIVYLRRSRSDDPNMTTEEVLQMHESLIRDWIDKNLDGPIPEENWYREIVSGETISEREELKKILKRMESPKIKAILCIECSRLSRGDMEDCGRLIKLLRYTNTLVIVQQQNRIFDLQDEFDRESFEREIKHSNYYLEYSKKLMKRGLDYVVENGGFVASVPPYGYKKVRIPWGKKKMPTLAIDEEEAKVVRMIFDWYVNEDLGHQRIAERLNDMGIKPMKVKRWCSQSIKKILGNEHYIGKIRYYAHKMEHQVNDMTVTKKKVAVKDYKLFDGLHEAIIDEEIFYRAKAKRDARPKVKKDNKIRNPLASILYCGECDHAMIYTVARGVPRYMCTENRRLCRNASIDANILIDMVCDALKKNIEDFTIELNSSNEDVIKKQEERIAYLQKRLKDIERNELSLWEKYTEEGMPKSVFENLKTKYESERNDIECSLDKAIKELPQRIDYEERIGALHSAIDGMRNDKISAEAKNNLMKACVERIYYTRELGVRVREEDRVEGMEYKRGWSQADPRIEITLKV